MRKKQYLILLIVLIVIVAALVGVIFGKKAKEKKETEAAEAETVYVEQFDVSDVTAFSYLVDGAEAVFTLTDGTWSYAGDATMELDTDTVEDFLEDMSGVTANSTIENVEDTAQYGLDSPTQTFTLTLSDGSTLTYQFGAENDVVGGVYVQVTNDADDTDNDNVYLVDSTVTSSTLATSVESFQVSDDEGSVSE